MAGARPAGYSGVQSKRTLSTTQDRGPGGGQVTTAITGSRHGKKTRSTPPGCMTTHTFGNGNLRRGDFASMSEVAAAPSDIRDIRVIPRLSQLLLELMLEIALPTFR